MLDAAIQENDFAPVFASSGIEIYPFHIAAASFAGKQLLHEPGLNVWVALAFALVFTIGWLPVFVVSLVMLLVWVAVGVVLMRRTKKD